MKNKIEEELSPLFCELDNFHIVRLDMVIGTI